MNQVIIGLGSNIQADANIAQAKEKIAARHHILAESQFVLTKPIGLAGQPDFSNGVLLIETDMERVELKRWLKQLEADMGRQKGLNKFGPRSIDLDILVWNGQVIHQDVLERDFLQKAILEVLPQIEF